MIAVYNSVLLSAALLNSTWS